MAANIRQSFAAITLQQQGYNLLDHPAITPRLRYTEAHQNGHLLRVLYLSSRPMSKHLRDKRVGDERMRDIITAAVEDRMQGLDYCWSANLDMPDSSLRGTRMPFVSHGLNNYQHHRAVVVLNIANLNPQCMQAMVELGFTAEQVKAAIMAESVYQAVSRSALRDPANDQPVLAIVPDLACADFLAARFPGCMVSALGEAEPPAASTRVARVSMPTTLPACARAARQRRPCATTASRHGGHGSWPKSSARLSGNANSTARRKMAVPVPKPASTL